MISIQAALILELWGHAIFHTVLPHTTCFFDGVQPDLRAITKMSLKCWAIKTLENPRNLQTGPSEAGFVLVFFLFRSALVLFDFSKREAWTIFHPKYPDPSKVGYFEDLYTPASYRFKLTLPLGGSNRCSLGAGDSILLADLFFRWISLTQTHSKGWLFGWRFKNGFPGGNLPRGHLFAVTMIYP